MAPARAIADSRSVENMGKAFGPLNPSRCSVLNGEVEGIVHSRTPIADNARVQKMENS